MKQLISTLASVLVIIVSTIIVGASPSVLLADDLADDARTKKSTEKNWRLLTEGASKGVSEQGKIILIRHALAPGNGDPANFKLNDCSTQRNLDERGIAQAKKLGEEFRSRKVPLDKVLSSEWCRCQDTARHAFKTYSTASFLNSTYSYPFTKNQKRQVKQLKDYVKKWHSKKNLVLVTHFSIITAVTDSYPASGEIVITDKDFKVLGEILIK